MSDCEPSLSTAIVTVRYCWRFHPEICYIALALGRGLRETKLVFAGSCCNKQTGGLIQRLVFAGSCCNEQTGGIILKAYAEETN